MRCVGQSAKNLNRYKALGLLRRVSEADLLIPIEPLVAGV